MLKQLRFYFNHSINDLHVNGQRTLFAILCIAAGVAAIVSLQTLGVMIEDSLTGSIQASNRGDIRLQIANTFAEDEDVGRDDIEQGKQEDFVATGGSFATDYITPEGLEQLRTWLDENYPGSETTYRQITFNLTTGTSVSFPEEGTEKTFVTPFIVNTDVYPLYGSVESEGGQSLAEAIEQPSDIVISRQMADDLKAGVGDTLRLSGATRDFTVAGIVPDDTESGFQNFNATLLGYYYLDFGAREFFDDLQTGAQVVYLRLPEGSDVSEVDEALKERFPYLTTTTTEDLREENSEVSQTLNEAVIIIGLISLLIGGIGIINTMLVIVARRTKEVAVLKTIGLEGEQITALFMVEAIIMGVIGSILGIGLGWLLALILEGVAENFLAQSLEFRITAAPPIVGFVVGVLVTTIFGLMPTLAASDVRPNLVLRPSDSAIPKTGRLRSFVTIILVMLALSVIAQFLVGDLLDTGPTVAESAAGDVPAELQDTRVLYLSTASLGGFIGLVTALVIIIGGALSGEWSLKKLLIRLLVWPLLLIGLPMALAAFGFFVPALSIMTATFIIVGILYIGLYGLIWLVGRFFPTFGITDLKVALRSMTAAKGRGASTLLALAIGVFSLSLITMFAESIINRFEQLLVDQVGGNIIILASGGGDTLEQVENRLQEQAGVNSYAITQNYNAELVSLNDVSENETVEFETLYQRVEEETSAGAASSFEASMSAISGRDVSSNLPDVEFYSGRQLSEQDAGQQRIVVPANSLTLAADIETGDLLTFNLSQPNTQTTRTVTFEVIGMEDRRQATLQVSFGASNYAPLGAFPDAIQPSLISAIVDVDENEVSTLKSSMNEISGVFVLETRLLNDLVNRFIERFTSFPILVAALALFTGGVVIANSVALTTLERRREIGIMKAVGLQRERVLAMLLLEYGVLGLIGGLIGVGISIIILILLLNTLFGGDLVEVIPYPTALALMAACVGIALVAAITTAWGASGEKPLNVLRYEQ